MAGTATPTPRRALRAASFALLAVLALPLLLACQRAERPELDAWEVLWREAEAVVPSVAELEGSEGESYCHDLLVAARELELTLLPAPIEALDAPIEAWITQAAHIGFECRARRGYPEQSRAEMHDLEVLGAEINAGLEAERG